MIEWKHGNFSHQPQNPHWCQIIIKSLSLLFIFRFTFLINIVLAFIFFSFSKLHLNVLFFFPFFLLFFSIFFSLYNFFFLTLDCLFFCFLSFFSCFAKRLFYFSYQKPQPTTAHNIPESINKGKSNFYFIFFL